MSIWRSQYFLKFIALLLKYIRAIRYKPIKNFLIHRYVARYHIDCHEIQDIDFIDFNDFYSRRVSRMLEQDKDFWIIPCDSKLISQENLRAQNKINAKGDYFLLHDLLVEPVSVCSNFNFGLTNIFYLGAEDSHQVVAPHDLLLNKYKFIPGKLHITDPEYLKSYDFI